MQDHGSVWEREYSRRGRLWGGMTPGLPLFPAGSRILELGCGSGKTLRTLSLQDLDLVAVDFSPSAASASRHLPAARSNPEIAVADARTLPFRGGVFDAILAIHVIGHLSLDDRHRGATEIVRILKPGGTLVFRVFSVADFRYGNGEKTEPATFRRGTGVSTHYFSPGEVTDLFPSLEPGSISPLRWSMRIRGKDLGREEIAGIFKKSL